MVSVAVTSEQSRSILCLDSQTLWVLFVWGTAQRLWPMAVGWYSQVLTVRFVGLSLPMGCHQPCPTEPWSLPAHSLRVWLFLAVVLSQHCLSYGWSSCWAGFALRYPGIRGAPAFPGTACSRVCLSGCAWITVPAEASLGHSPHFLPQESLSHPTRPCV